MWCIYIIHQLNKGLDLNTAINQELYGTGDDLYQNDRDIEMWFSYNYARVILSQNGMRRTTPPDFLFKHRIQTCKCHNYSHHLSKKYPTYNVNMLRRSIVNNEQRDGPNPLSLYSVIVSGAVKL